MLCFFSSAISDTCFGTYDGWPSLRFDFNRRVFYFPISVYKNVFPHHCMSSSITQGFKTMEKKMFLI